jgi:inosine-uridine nucleoside N-ribohydrolase
MLLDPSLGCHEAMQIGIETCGRLTGGMMVPAINGDGNNPMRVALDVDVARAEECIVPRIAVV